MDIRAAIEKIEEMTKPLFLEVDGATFCVGANGSPVEISKFPVIPQTLELTSLDSMVKLIKTEALARYKAPLYITIPDHMTAKCFAQPVQENEYIREVYYTATATDVPGWGDRTELPFEEALIALRTRFQESTDIDYALKLLSDITTGAKMTYSDNGIAKSIVSKKGVDLQTNESIRPILSLAPYRTFQEVTQPASPFLIRVNEHSISFIEADGGMWKLKARNTVKEHLEKELVKEVKSGEVIIAL